VGRRLINWKENYWIKESTTNLPEGNVKIYHVNDDSREKTWIKSFDKLEQAFEYVIKEANSIYQRHGIFAEIIIEYENWKYYVLGNPDVDAFNGFPDRVKRDYDRHDIFGFYEPGNPILWDAGEETVWVNRKGKMLMAVV